MLLDASGSAAPPGRSLVAFAWTIRRTTDGAPVATVDGARVPVWLASGEYDVELTATDTSGQAATAAARFAVGDAAATAAVIASPHSGELVEQPPGSGSAPVDVALSGAGSAAGPGRSLVRYTWRVARLPDGMTVGQRDGAVAALALPSGRYRATLEVTDSSGGLASADTEFAVGSRGPGGAAAAVSYTPLTLPTNREV